MNWISIDQTIETLCEWVQTESERAKYEDAGSILPDMVKALAELVSARAKWN